MKSVRNTASAWSKEYQRKGIPSSFRDRPSNAIFWAEGEARNFRPQKVRKRRQKKTALDLGCGTGRNARELARRGYRVTAIDFSPYAIAQAKKKRRKNIQYLCRNLTKTLPFPSPRFDLVVDLFCYPHIVAEPARTRYRSEIIRVLHPGSFYVLALATPDDGYYGQFLKHSPDRKRNLIIDPVAKVPLIVSSIQTIRREFYPLHLRKVHRCTKRDIMHGTYYRRKSIAFLFQK